jgi:4-amino-4-deoxy-L-arabinose transferase-like glycosyltransferase
MRSRTLLLAAILICCVVGRGAHVLYLAHSHDIVTTVGDTPTYLGPAKELLDHGRFDSATPPGQPEYLRTPGYPVFIAAVYRIFGESNTAVLLAQVLLSALTVFLAYLLAARMWSVPIGLLAALFTALDPVQNATSSTILTESLAALLLIVVAAVGFEAFRQQRPRPGSWALLGSAIAIATLVRPVTYYLPLLVVLLLVVRHARRRDRWLNLAKVTAAFMLPLVVLLGGWQLRNHERVDSWRISGIEAKNLYLFRAAGAVARSSGKTFAVTQHEMRQAFGPVGTESQGSYYGRMYRTGLHIVASHPVDAFVDTINGLRSELFSVRPKSFAFLGFRPGSAITDVAVVLLVAFYAVCAYGMVLVVRRRRDLLAHAFVAGIAFYVLLASAGPEALGERGERFRAPIIPILILYAARGAWELYASARARRWKWSPRPL